MFYGVDRCIETVVVFDTTGLSPRALDMPCDMKSYVNILKKMNIGSGLDVAVSSSSTLVIISSSS